MQGDPDKYREGKGVIESSVNPGREGKGGSETKRFEIKRLAKLHCMRPARLARPAPVPICCPKYAEFQFTRLSVIKIDIAVIGQFVGYFPEGFFVLLVIPQITKPAQTVISPG